MGKWGKTWVNGMKGGKLKVNMDKWGKAWINWSKYG